MDDEHLPDDFIKRAHFDDELDAAERIVLYVIGHQALHFAFSCILLNDEETGLHYPWTQATRAIMLALPQIGHGNLDALARVAQEMVIKPHTSQSCEHKKGWLSRGCVQRIVLQMIGISITLN